MKFSVIIPACNRPECLARCLRGLEPGDAEVIVTDDSTHDAVRLLLEQEFPMVRWIPGPRRGPAANRNSGVRAATGDWLAFVDDDCEPQPGWLAAFGRAADDADVVEGCTEAPGATDSPFEEHVDNLHGGVLWSCNLAVRRDVFEKLAGFDEDFHQAAGEDMEFASRVQRAGLRVRFAPDAIVHHPPRQIGWRGVWRRTWMIRWMSLYRLKTGEARSWPVEIANEIVLLLRITAQLVTRRDGRWPRRQVFTVAWRWFTFPLVLPYVLYWNRRFARRLAA